MDTSLQATTHHRASSARDGGFEFDVHGLWRRWRQRLHMRAELRAMDARALADIGLDPESARQETRKFFWQC
jgi:uncharacterized protein YjiS (DUF1127 family)